MNRIAILLSTALLFLTPLSVARAKEIDPETEALLKSIRVQAKGIQYNKYVSFNDQGVFSKGGESLRVNIHLECKGFHLITVSGLIVTHVLTDTGAVLVQNDWPSHLNRSHFQRQGKRLFTNITVNFSAPDRPFNMIRELSGSLDVTLAVGRLQQITLFPLTKYLNRRVRVEGYDRFFLKPTRQNGDCLRLRLSSELNKLLSAVRFFSPKGLEMRVHSEGYSSAMSNPVRYFKKFRPSMGNARMVIFFHEKTRTIKVPVKLTSLSFGTAGDESGDNLSVKPVIVEKKKK